MVIYLTSRIGGYYKENGTRNSTPLSAENGLLDSFRKHWKDNSKVLIISANPEDIEKNNRIKNIYAASFPMSGLSVSQTDICDNRNANLLDKISEYDVLILAGGACSNTKQIFWNNTFKRTAP